MSHKPAHELQPAPFTGTAGSADLLNQLIDRVVDRDAVDWSALDAAPIDPALRERLQLLRILDGLGDVVTDAAEGPVEPAGAPESQAAAHAEPWGRYRLDQVIGEGNFGRVYRAWDAQLQMPVAIKILHPHVAQDARDHLLREAQALGQVRHPNVVRVLCVETHEERRGLCMEYIQGETLHEQVERQGPLGHREVRAIAEEICAALSAIHAAGFIHRDVKARNVMRERAGRVVLMDLGARESLLEVTSAADGQNLGTPFYMAPELFDNPHATKATDVYSLGVLLFFLLTGRYPVEADSIAALRDAHARRKRQLVADLRPDVPPALARAIDRACAASPADRYKTAAELQSALDVHPSQGRVSGRILKNALALAAVMASLTGMGLLSSQAFNATLERSGFSSESLVDLLGFGLRASVLPTVFFAIALWTLGLAAALRALLLKSRRAAALDRWVRERMEHAGVSDPTVIASVMLTVSGGVLVGVWWYYAPLLEALTSRVSSAPAETLTVLSPSSIPYHTEYRTTLIRVLIVVAGGWYLAAQRSAEKGVTLHVALRLGAVATMVLLVATLQLPYRLIFDSKAAVYKWGQQECYATGQRGDELLLFCPGLPVPRNRIVSRTASDVAPAGRVESIFTPFSARPATVAASPLGR